MNYQDLEHEIECQSQPYEFPCICDKIKEDREKQEADMLENEATGN